MTLLLKDFPYRNDGKLRILEFAARLANDSDIKTQQLHLEINKWFERYNFEKPNIPDRNAKGYCQPLLFVKIAPSHHSQPDTDQFLIEAWLIPNQSWVIDNTETLKDFYSSREYYYLNLSYLDMDDFSDLVTPKLCEKLNTIKTGKRKLRDAAFSENELQELLNLLLNESAHILRVEEIDEQQLTVEIFLPAELLCTCSIEKWNFFDIFNIKDTPASKLPIGSSYRILLRSWERSNWLNISIDSDPRGFKRYSRRRDDWKRRWQLVKDKLKLIPNDNDFELIDKIDTLDKEQLENKIGVKLGRTTSITTRDNLLKTVIHDAGIPIVLWTRCEDYSLDYITKINDLVHQTVLIDLPECIRKTRKDARKFPENHLGHHLVLLWDDPTRFPPDEGFLEQST